MSNKRAIFHHVTKLESAQPRPQVCNSRQVVVLDLKASIETDCVDQGESTFGELTHRLHFALLHILDGVQRDRLRSFKLEGGNERDADSCLFRSMKDHKSTLETVHVVTSWFRIAEWPRGFIE